MTCMSCYGFFSVTVPRMYPFNPRLNFRVAHCLKLSGNWPLLYMKVMKVTKWQLKSRKLRTIVSILIAKENLLNHPELLYASGSSHCDRHRYWYTRRTLTNELFLEIAGRKGARHKKCFQHALFLAELHARAKRARGWSPIAKVIYPSQKIW